MKLSWRMRAEESAADVVWERRGYLGVVERAMAATVLVVSKILDIAGSAARTQPGQPARTPAFR